MIIHFLKNKKQLVFFALIILCIGFIFGFWVYQLSFSCHKNGFKYINPDLVCDKDIVVSKKAYVPLSSNIKNLIEEKIKSKDISDASIYFRDLQNGPTLGINEYEKFSPASLLKLPLLISYFNLSESNPDLLNTEIGFDNYTEVLNQYYPSKETVKENTPYKISELLSSMIKYSDNKAYYALRQYLSQTNPSKDLLQQTFIDLGIIDPKNFTDQTISVKAYSSLFIQLYHSSFFSQKETSEKALDILSQTDYINGINQGIPTDIKIAHKFGERSGLPNGEVQLHDCGIVYYPNNPYLLCVMTRGTSFDKLSKFIGSISEMVYQEFDSRKL